MYTFRRMLLRRSKAYTHVASLPVAVAVAVAVIVVVLVAVAVAVRVAVAVNAADHAKVCYGLMLLFVLFMILLL